MTDLPPQLKLIAVNDTSLYEKLEYAYILGKRDAFESMLYKLIEIEVKK